MDFLTQLLMGQTAPFTGSPGQAGFPAIIDPRNKLGGLRTQVLPDPLNPQPAAFPDQPAYPPLGASLQPAGNNGVVPTTTALDENGQPLPTYARGERPPASMAPDTGRTEAGGTPSTAPRRGGLIEGLRGLAQPARPDVVKTSTPHLPPLRPIQGGELIQLMTSLGIGPKDIPGLRQTIGR
jgi:hypothetical protein